MSNYYGEARRGLCSLILLASYLILVKDVNFTVRAETTKISSKTVENEYIVVFKEYLSSVEQVSAIAQIIGASTSLSPEHSPQPGQSEADGRDHEPPRRFNYKTLSHGLRKIPSDFVVVKFNASTPYEDALTALKKHDLVKFVVPERVHEDLLSQIKESGGAVGRDRRSVAEGARGVDQGGGNGARDLAAQGDGGEGAHALHAPYLMNADYLWDAQHTGVGVKVAIFDTGLSATHSHFRNVRLRTDWTDEDELDDVLGHGTFVAGVIAGSSEECRGFAPDAELHIFRVFTRERVSYTSWFLDAFNYCIHSDIDILNLSIGGPDFLDEPFVEKVWELSANNVIVVSAIGNDGPVYGTLNNPADQSDVLGVGGMQYDEQVSQFSSRGMTTWELPTGYGRVKPDLVAYAQNVAGSTLSDGCRTLSGTSVASPVVAGVVTLLASTVGEKERKQKVNPASMKQVLVEGAERVRHGNIFEQGVGKINLLRSYEILQSYTPRVSFHPSYFDLTDCPYMWPLCTQPLYYSSRPLILNVTILNGVAVTGKIVGTPKWIGGVNGEHVQVAFDYRDLIWPWTGNLGALFRVPESSAGFSGVVEGVVEVTVRSYPSSPVQTDGNKLDTDSTLHLPVRLEVIPTPPRERRILWDQYHNLRYPSGYFPRDALWVKNEPFDWNADHIHTNFKGLYDSLRSQGYYVEVLGSPYTCFDAENYGTLLVVDPEEEFHPEEIEKLQIDIKEKGLSLLLFADWYDTEVMDRVNFYDENTQQWWRPVTGGSNIPALNDLLEPFGIAFGDRVFDGNIRIGSHMTHAASAASIARFPGTSAGVFSSSLLSFMLQEQSMEIIAGKESYSKAALLGFMQPTRDSGRIVAFGDSSCVDDAHQDMPCYWLLSDMLQYTAHSTILASYQKVDLRQNFFSNSLRRPMRPSEDALASYSKVIGQKPQCSVRTYTTWVPFDVVDDVDGEGGVGVSLEWPDPVYSTAKIAEGTGPHWREKGLGSSTGTHTSVSMLRVAYVVPYILVLLVLIFLLSVLSGKRLSHFGGKSLPVV